MDQQPQNQRGETPNDAEVPTLSQETAALGTPGAENESASVTSPIESEQPTAEPVVTAPAAPVPAAGSDADRPNQLAALVIAAVFGLYGIHQLYIGNKVQGFVRLALAILPIPLLLLLILFTIFFSSIPTVFIFILGALLTLSLPVLVIWALVDFIRIGFGFAKDNHGRAMLASKRDANWARALTVTGIVLLILYFALFIVSSAVGVSDAFNTTESDTQNQYQYDIDSSVIGPTVDDI